MCSLWLKCNDRRNYKTMAWNVQRWLSKFSHLRVKWSRFVVNDHVQSGKQGICERRSFVILDILCEIMIIWPYNHMK
jgi:hypothetical protein